MKQVSKALFNEDITDSSMGNLLPNCKLEWIKKDLSRKSFLDGDTAVVCLSFDKQILFVFFRAAQRIAFYIDKCYNKKFIFLP